MVKEREWGRGESKVGKGGRKRREEKGGVQGK